MGEAKRRREAGMPRETGKKLPDFIFGRDWDAEGGAITLAGKLVTDWPLGSGRPNQDDEVFLKALFQELTEAVLHDPHLAEVGIWRGGQKPPDGLAPPFPDRDMERRTRDCVVIAVRVDGTKPH